MTTITLFPTRKVSIFCAVFYLCSIRMPGGVDLVCLFFFRLIAVLVGGRTELSNCQILQSRVNNLKSNKDNDPELQKGYSCAYEFNGTSSSMLCSERRLHTNCISNRARMHRPRFEAFFQFSLMFRAIYSFVCLFVR